ncbi:HD-like signal output (HDOD) domain, no enzymatic activity [Nitrosomonas marina]|uniref:HD-like signal output (HDOD) domain, no enzymatic activity n=1 Tax=Nitrosomonas marina TaxID=917 RepID=A0A1I0CIU5_9PROT|nr:HDOD domain-containing protein [Nitrosomonas marina]SET19518.1 HD-like signal output (HDOD) domain, no enzymatic activity [Nitrosomonas marina]
MVEENNSKLDQCVTYLAQAEIPVLKQTARKLSAVIENVDRLSARNIAQIIKNDPLMVVKLMRYFQLHRGRSQIHEIMEVEQTLLMLGLENTLKIASAKPYVEDLLGTDHREALVCLLKVTQRNRMASAYAYDWAVRLQDLHYEEIRIAALMYDIAEILMWCYAPKAMLKIKHLQTKNKAVRSRQIQEKLLGFSLHALQFALITRWKLPGLLRTLMDDNCHDQQRVKNVLLAVNLARHAANGWDDAALPKDYEQIGQLLHLDPEEVITVISHKKF